MGKDQGRGWRRQGEVRQGLILAHSFDIAAAPMAIAHRGSRLLWPENTLPAFQGVADLGLEFFETDLHVTRDGVLVAFHDDLLDRTTDTKGPISERWWPELESVDAGHNFAPHAGYPWRGKGVRIPRLDELMDTFTEVGFILDLKQAGTEEKLAELLQLRGWEDRVIVGSFSDIRMRRFREASKGRVWTSSGPVEAAAHWLALRLGRQLPGAARAIQIPEYLFQRLVGGKLESVHAAGRQVHVWTVNDPEAMNHFLDEGVDGIITDRPDLLRALLERRQQWKLG